MTTQYSTRAQVAALCHEALFADGFDDAILGVVSRINTEAVCYDYTKCVCGDPHDA